MSSGVPSCLSSCPKDIGIWSRHFRDYWILCKPRVVALMLVTALVGMCLAGSIIQEATLVLSALLGIGLCAGSAAAINHVLDKKIDRMMQRTADRPLAQERITVPSALIFALCLGILGFSILWFFANRLTAILTVCTLLGYAIVYTGFLKRATSQNIVIGGLAGAAPPLLGWCAMTNQLAPQALLLVLIIFTWTPPHFWALAIYRYDDYKNANIPMLPVTHGIAYTRLQILLYTILLLPVSWFPWLVGMSGLLYMLSAMVLGFVFLYWALRLFYQKDRIIAMQTFRYSIIYLLGLFVAMLVDHCIFS